jgi:2-oxoglutarate dehydrogenase E2 component (dihydrolipoamide succinyltransferase)
VIIDVTVPVLAESVPDATLISWSKAVGDAVVSGEILIEVETDKVVLEVVAPNDGILSEILRPDGDTVLSGEVLARIDTEGVVTATSSAPSPAAAPAQAAISAPPTASAPAVHQAESDDLAQSPAVRKLVAEHRLDPSTITGSGKGGRLTKGDILAFIEQRAANPTSPAPATPAKPPAPVKATPAPVPGSRGEHREPMSRLRQRIAERLVHAQQTAAILTTFNEVNMAPIMELRNRHKESFEKTYGVRLGFMSFFAKAAVQALRRYPAVNAYIDGKEIVYHDFCDVGVAVGSPRGLVVPILRNVEAMTFADIERSVTDFGERARAGSLSIEDMTGGTFTISNGGVFGSLLSTPILNPPQSAILGMHKTQERPMAENGQVVVRPMMYLALSYDHRIVDGREAVLFLVAIKEALEDPSRMLLEL